VCRRFESCRGHSTSCLVSVLLLRRTGVCDRRDPAPNPHRIRSSRENPAAEGQVNKGAWRITNWNDAGDRQPCPRWFANPDYRADTVLISIPKWCVGEPRQIRWNVECHPIQPRRRMARASPTPCPAGTPSAALRGPYRASVRLRSRAFAHAGHSGRSTPVAPRPCDDQAEVLTVAASSFGRPRQVGAITVGLTSHHSSRQSKVSSALASL
jgi:hypothetical protein